MSSSFGILLKKQLKEQFSVVGKDKKNVDWAGLLLSLVLTAVIIAVVCFVFKAFAEVYVGVKVNRVPNVEERKFEILSSVYMAIILLNALGGVKTVNDSLFKSDDLRILIYMPIRSGTLFGTKLLGAYIKQLATSIITIVPINVTLGLVTPVNTFFWGMTALSVFLIPFISLAIGSLLAFPVYYIKRAISSRYVITLIIITAVTALIFWGYSVILGFIKDLLSTGDVRFFFNAEVMQKIGDATSKLYPSVFFANILLGRDLTVSVISVFAISLGSAALGLGIGRFLLIPAAQERFSGGSRYVYRSSRVSGSRPVTASLMKKEFLLVLRTPSYAFQYFSTAIIMPLMVYFCMNIFSELISTTMLVDCNLELSIFLIIMFGVLTNTFCATNISRDGEIFFAMKTMPLGHRKIVKAKILFCFAVSGASIVVSSALVAGLGFISVGQCFFVMAVTLLISCAQICFATRKDFNHPRFSTEDDGEIKESNGTISSLIILGLIVSFGIGVVSLYCGLVLKIKNGVMFGETISMVATAAVAIVLFVLALIYLLRGLDKKYYELSEASV